jgi:multicomponent Na+:H+ antiporter subunit G
MTSLGLVFIALGLAFNFFGCLGLVRLPDVYNRLQAATKSVTLGTCSVLFGVLLMSGVSATGLKCLLTIVFLLLTAPVAAHAISRAGRRGGVALAPGSVCDAYPYPASSEGPERAEAEGDSEAKRDRDATKPEEARK